MAHRILGWLALLSCYGYVIAAEWEAAVTTDNGILFFDSNWQKISSAAHQYTRLSAFAYDEVLGKLYFSDLNDPEYRVCALEFDENNENHKVTKLLPNSPETTTILAMAFDHLERKLYWTEKSTHKIYSIEIDPLLDGAARRKQGEVNVTFPLPETVATVEKDDDLSGIAIDECRRHLYWTNSYLQRSNIVRAAMNGTILNTHEKDVYHPRGLTIDHYRNRLYWVEKKYGRRYNIESTDLEITNLSTLISDLDRNPVDIAVSNAFVYWADQDNNDIYETAKNSSQQTRSVYHGEHPSAVILRANLLLDHQKNNPDCTGVIASILENMEKPKLSDELRKKQQTSEQNQVTVCLNDGTVNPNTRSCICKPSYTGKFCETNVCQNFCLHGSCTMGRDNKPRCECESPYEGIRCDQKPCDGFCLNDGVCQSKNETERVCQCKSGYTGDRCEKPVCSKDYCFQGECVVDQDNQPTCPCPPGFRGKRCEENSCNNHCMNGGTCTLNNETVPECQCGDEFTGKRCEIPVRICEHPQWKQQCLDTAKTTPQVEPKVTYCKESFNRTVVYTSLCFTVSFILLLIIVLTVHRMMKPPRPRITKKMVVTPMTSRPPTTQCEITIENCCNMNVCETPCFDTKLLKNSPKKDDKVYLLEDIEDVGGTYRKLHNCDDGAEKFNGSVRK